MTAQFVTVDRFHANILDKLGIKVNGGNHEEPVRRRKEVLFFDFTSCLELNPAQPARHQPQMGCDFP
jgi:hypothetical protein